MATRVGKIILLEDLLKKTIEKAHDEIKKRKTKGDATKIGVGAIKYIILRNEPIKDVEFSWKSALNFEGDSGPYLQYAHTRCSGILRKSKNLKLSYSIKQLTDQEKRLLKMLSMFPETVEQAAINLKPSQICNYVYDLATSFNEFYEKCPVIKAEKELKNFRLTLVNATAIVLKNALNLIGIEAVDKM
jgi:arginyl-tRNA synthetase